MDIVMNVPDQGHATLLGDCPEYMHLEAVAVDDVRIDFPQQFSQSQCINSDSRNGKQ